MSTENHLWRKAFSKNIYFILVQVPVRLMGEEGLILLLHPTARVRAVGELSVIHHYLHVALIISTESTAVLRTSTKSPEHRSRHVG